MRRQIQTSEIHEEIPFIYTAKTGPAPEASHVHDVGGAPIWSPKIPYGIPPKKGLFQKEIFIPTINSWGICQFSGGSKFSVPTPKTLKKNLHGNGVYIVPPVPQRANRFNRTQVEPPKMLQPENSWISCFCRYMGVSN